MKKIILVSTFLISSIALLAQEYDLNQYNYRFRKVRGFGFGLNTNGNGQINANNTDFNNNYTGIYRNGIDNYNYNNGQINFGGNLNYFSNQNTDKNIIFTRASASLGLSFDNQMENQNRYNQSNDFTKSTSRTLTNGTGASWSRQQYQYRTERKFNYFLVQPSVSFGTINRKGNFDSAGTFIENSFSVRPRLNAAIGKGFGRINDVTDMAIALFLIKDLQDKGGLGTLSQKQMEEVGLLITQTLNTRFIDFRFRLIDQISMLDSGLKRQGITIENELIYFTTVYDNWQFAQRINRNTGKEWLFSVSNNFNFFNSNNTSEVERVFSQRAEERNSQELSNSSAFNISYRNLRQKNMYRENGLIANVSIGYFFNNFDPDNKRTDNDPNQTNLNENSLTDFSQPFINLGITKQGIYQPNSRNSHTWALSPYANVSRSNANFREEQIIPTFRLSNSSAEINNINAGLNLRYDYFHFFSQFLTFNVSFGLNTNYGIASEESVINTEAFGRVSNELNMRPIFNIGFNYTFF